MKLPPQTAHLSLKRGSFFARSRVAAGAGLIPSSRDAGFRIRVCTANLGATDTKPGDPGLKHCFAKIENADGEVVDTFAFGRSGLGTEPFPDLGCVTCETQATGLGRREIEEFAEAFQSHGALPYEWGSNDCCSCLESAVRDGLRLKPVGTLREASEAIAGAPEVVLQ